MVEISPERPNPFLPNGVMLEHDTTYPDAIRVARLYYYQGLTTEAIAAELALSRSKVSRLLTFAREQGLVEIRILDASEHLNALERDIRERFRIRSVKVVSVPEVAGERVWLERVATFTASYLNTLLTDNTVLGVAWGTTVSAVSRHLTPKRTVNMDIVQLNGSGNTYSISDPYSSEIIMRFAHNYGARAHLFPVPTFFDFPETKRALWRERSIRRITELQARADLLLYSIGAVYAGVPSHVYSGGYLEEEDLHELAKQGVAGDIATVFFREDGSCHDIPLNERASGPDLGLFKGPAHALCVVSGRGKIGGLRAALRGGYLSDLILDEPTARGLLEAL